MKTATKTTVEKVRMIAEFMGYEVIPYNGDLNKPIYNGNKYAQTIGELNKLWGGLDLQFTGRFIENATFPFQTDFNYLLPIINLIEKNGYVIGIAGISYKVYKPFEDNKPIIALVCGDLSKKTEMVFNLIIEFIEYYNQNKLTFTY